MVRYPETSIDPENQLWLVTPKNTPPSLGDERNNEVTYVPHGISFGLAKYNKLFPI